MLRLHFVGPKTLTQCSPIQTMYCLDTRQCNTNQKKDGHIAGTKYITKKGKRAQRRSPTSEGCFTILPFFATNGKPVFCVVIFQSKQLSPNFESAHGIDIKNNQLEMILVK